MPQTDPPLTPATADDLAQAIAFALRFNGRKRYHNADELMADIVAEHVIEHLALSGFVVMKRPPLSPASTPGRVR